MHCIQDSDRSDHLGLSAPNIHLDPAPFIRDKQTGTKTKTKAMAY